MASADEERYLRMCLIMQKVAVPIFRDVFKQTVQQSISPMSLNQLLLNNHTDLKKIRVINRQQLDLLFPKSGNVSTDDFDVTLLMLLTRNLKNAGSNIFSKPACLCPGTSTACKCKPWDNPPIARDFSTEVDFTRIKLWRNNIAHHLTGTLSEHNYNTLVSDMTSTFTRLQNKTSMSCDYFRTFNQVLYGSIVIEEAEIVRQMLKTEQEVKTLVVTETKGLHEDHQNIKDAMNRYAEESKTDINMIKSEIQQTGIAIVDSIRKKNSEETEQTKQMLELQQEVKMLVVTETKGLQEDHLTITDAMNRYAEDNRTDNEKTRLDIIQEVRSGFQDVKSQIEQSHSATIDSITQQSTKKTDRVEIDKSDWLETVNYTIGQISPRLLKALCDRSLQYPF